MEQVSPDLELEVKQLIIDSLSLEDIEPEDIDSEEPLFGDGLRRETRHTPSGRGESAVGRTLIAFKRWSCEAVFMKQCL